MKSKSFGIINMLIIALIMSGLAAGCSSGMIDGNGSKLTSKESMQVNGKQSEGDEQKSNQIMLKLLLNSPELTEQYYDMAREYKSRFPNVTLDLTILQNDYQTVLKSKLNSGDIPDVFITGAYYENKVYNSYMYDLTGEDFIKQIEPSALKTVTLDGRITGYPFLLQAHSFIYNKKVFMKAGITELPKNKKDLDDICGKLVARGIQPFATGFGEWWVMEQISTQYMTSVKDSYGGDYSKLADDLNSGKKKFGDIKELSDVFDIIDMMLKYGGPKPMDTDFNTQCQLLAAGKAAMIHQGTWAEETIKKVNPDADIGFMPAPVSDNPEKAGLMVDSNLCIRIYKESRQLKAALDWMNWLITSDYGKSWVPDKCHQISTIKGAKIPDTQLAKDTMDYMGRNKVYPWFKGYYIDGFEEQLGLTFQAYAAGNKTREQAREELSQTYKRLVR